MEPAMFSRCLRVVESLCDRETAHCFALVVVYERHASPIRLAESEMWRDFLMSLGQPRLSLRDGDTERYSGRCCRHV